MHSPARSIRRFWLKLVIQAGLLLLVYLAIQTWQSRHAMHGEAPDIEAVLLDGSRASLQAYRGRPVLVHFWASWCSICEFEHDTITALGEDYAVLSVASHSGDAEAVAAYVSKQAIRVPVLVDEDGAWARLYGVRGFPTSFVVDGKGQIYAVEVGYTSGLGLRVRLALAGDGA